MASRHLTAAHEVARGLAVTRLRPRTAPATLTRTRVGPAGATLPDRGAGGPRRGGFGVCLSTAPRRAETDETKRH